MKKKFYLTGCIMLAVFAVLFIMSIIFKWDMVLLPAGVMGAAVLAAFIGSTRKKNF